MHVEPMGNYEMQVVFGPRHGHIQQPALFIDLRLGARAQIGGNAAVHHVEHEYTRPLLPLGRMDG